MKRALLVILGVVAWQITFAQVNNPGYLGKKTFIGISAGYCPNFAYLRNQESGINYRNKEIGYFITPLTYAVGVGRAINYHWTIAVDYEFQRYGVFKESSVPMNWDLNTNSGEYAYARAAANTVRLKFTYANDIPAPMGSYTSFGFMFQNNKVSAVRGEGEGYVFANPGEVEDFGSYFDYGLFFGAGLKREVFPSVVVDLAFDINMYLARYIMGSPEENPYFPLTEEMSKEYLHQGSAQKNHQNSWLITRAGIYYLF